MSIMISSQVCPLSSIEAIIAMCVTKVINAKKSTNVITYVLHVIKYTILKTLTGFFVTIVTVFSTEMFAFNFMQKKQVKDDPHVIHITGVKTVDKL